MNYKITKKFGRGADTPIGNAYPDQKSAERAIFEKLNEDKLFKIEAVYCLYEGMDVLKEYTQKDLPAEITDTSSSKERSASQNFSPSPLQMSPRPKGLPVSGFKDDDSKGK